MIFAQNGISWFAVPQRLVNGSKRKPALIGQLTAGALRLYLFILAKAGSETRPIVSVTNAQIAVGAGVTRTNVQKAREELVSHGLVTVENKGAEFVFEVLKPDTDEDLPPGIKNVQAGPHTLKQVQTVFDHYIGSHRLPDNDNGMLFMCPLHTGGINSNSKRKKYLLSVKESPTGLWHCANPRCKHHGKRREEIITEGTWGAPVDNVVTGGGGDILDFVAAMRSGTPITRKQALELLMATLPGAPAEPAKRSRF